MAVIRRDLIFLSGLKRLLVSGLAAFATVSLLLTDSAAADGGAPPLAVAPFDAKQAKAHQQAWAKYLKTEIEVTNSIGIKLMLIPPGEFLMGSSADDIAAVLKIDSAAKAEYFTDEHPRHNVRLTKPYRLGATEVTVGQFRRFVTATGYQTDAERDGKGGWGWGRSEQAGNFVGRKPEYTWKNPDFAQTDAHPVVNVSWNDAEAFVKWLSGQEGDKYRLPTEAEWEYACRAGTTSLWWHGNDAEGLALSGNVADRDAWERWGKNYAEYYYIMGRDGDALTGTVGRTSRTNPFGLSDLHGNVSEWCEDWYDGEFYGQTAGTAVDPFHANPAEYRVLRGGAWNIDVWVSRSAERDWSLPVNRDVSLGFRVSRTE